ncbi:hypothetical protein [Campylobacter corcagiensis]|uniref:Uncharacterized protein n=1 Tax=Campylobacter corcagiensis TaxID=1448857 RepID=A0A7M1LF40_9BACT|nr:hypothetical protein [Campylobacter corcagiensis]QKF64879.1 hypothetical protein CCORG_1028 [Campylobacter corcagiensis]QOQ86961.1 hypothetical protein IMC76_07035 [Campylobacter corcagiensis]
MNQNEINDLMYEVSVLLEAVLYFAGVDKKYLRKAAEVYVEMIDEALDDKDLKGVDEVIEVVKFLKADHPEFFKK